MLAGARLGHCIFYQPDYFLTSGKGIIEMLLPIHIQDNGSWSYIGYRGLASHGGTIGLFVALAFYWKAVKLKPMMVLDNVAIAAPVTACCIRLGNLMNSEIIGKTTDVPWAFIFHSQEAMVNGELVPRHPAQLYEALAYLLIFAIGVFLYQYWLKSQHTEFVLAEKQGIKSNDFRKIKTVIDENADIIIKRWNEHFNK